MLCAGLLWSGVLSVPAEASPDPNDVYAIDIEFGNLSFYYDYGVWDVNDMRYEASATSTHPANGTTLGYPGWYGFDDISNKISITNHSESGRSVTVALDYRSLTSTELTAAGAENVVSGVSMTVSGTPAKPDSAVSTVVAVWQPADNSATVPSDATVVGYIHLSGEPKLPDGSVYDSASMQPIGMLTLTITSP